jgi:hypothetical protein
MPEFSQKLFLLLQIVIYKPVIIKCFTICRENLDPQSVYTDMELWKSLELAQLKDAVSSLPGCLGMVLNEVERFLLLHLEDLHFFLILMF